MCILTGAKIEEYSVFSAQPHVTHTKSRIPIVGNILISSAPIFGGIFSLYLVNTFLPSGDFALIRVVSSWSEILTLPLALVGKINIFSLGGIIMIMLLVNGGAMIGPSLQDIKNIWFVFIPLVFIKIDILNNLCFTALIIILANIYIQISLILLIKTISKFKN
jgi:hypothetical protein